MNYYLKFQNPYFEFIFFCLGEKNRNCVKIQNASTYVSNPVLTQSWDFRIDFSYASICQACIFTLVLVDPVTVKQLLLKFQNPSFDFIFFCLGEKKRNCVKIQNASTYVSNPVLTQGWDFKIDFSYTSISQACIFTLVLVNPVTMKQYSFLLLSDDCFAMIGCCFVYYLHF